MFLWHERLLLDWYVSIINLFDTSDFIALVEWNKNNEKNNLIIDLKTIH